MGKHKQGKENDQSRGAKAVWNKDMVNIFCDTCIRAIGMGMRPGTHLTREGWNYVIKQFEKESGQFFSRKQLKNKWDGTKKEWKTWKALIGREQVGWDIKKQTLIGVSDPWWDEKIKAMPAAKKFRNGGIDPELSAKYDIIFMDPAAVGNCDLPPSTVHISDDKDENDEDESPSDNDVPSNKDGNDESPISNTMSLECSDNSRNEPNFVESMEQIMDGANVSSAMIDGVNVLSDCPTQAAAMLQNAGQSEEKREERKQKTMHQNAGQSEEKRNEMKRKRVDESDTQIDPSKKSKVGSGQLEGLTKLSWQIHRLATTVESNNCATSMRMDLPGCGIREVMADLHSIPEIVKGSDLHLFATDLFLSRGKREMYVSLGESDVKLTWLKYQHDKFRVDI